MVISEPDPAEAAIFKEVVEIRLASLDSELRQIALWKLEGWTNMEIAKQLNFTDQTIRNKVAIIQGLWEAAGYA